MPSTFWGVALAIIAGLGTGTCLWPMKIIRKFRFEHYWFLGMLPLIIIPWLVVLASVGNPFPVIAEIGWKPLLLSNLFAIGWGVANVLAGICTVRIGFTLCGAILTGVSTAATVTLPMVFKGTGIFSNSPGLLTAPGLIILAGVAITLIGVFFSAAAGFGRERVLQSGANPARGGSFLGGLILTIIASLLSVGQVFAFVYSQGPIITAMKNHGAGEVSANFAFWAVGLLGGALVNIIYPAWVMTKNRSWGVLKQSPREFLLSALIGSQLIAAFAVQGIGMIALGALGASVGTGIKQVGQFVSGQGVGFATGEWRGVRGRPRALMFVAIALLLAAAALMIWARRLNS